MQKDNYFYTFDRLTLEVSLKPFYATGERELREVCAQLCDNWRGLAHRTELIAFQLFIGDGDEVLNWRGEFGDRINWCDSTGCSNMPQGYNFVHPQAEEKIGEGLPVWTYDDLRTLIRCLKEAASEYLGLPSIVGTIFDAGAEFVESEFKFARHPELMRNGKDLGLDGIFGPFVDVTAKLTEDSYGYAAYPDGIPPGGVGFGEFFGRQFRSLADAVGFDYIWFSNGLGFGYTPWETRGPLFDGEAFHPEAFAQTNAAIVRFWRDFDRHSGGMPIGIRGSNTSIGSDLSVFGISVKDVLASANIMMPAPNPPWGSYNPGLEFAVYLSRMASRPDGGYPYRFYYNDTWFHSDPWYGYYGAEPFDILMPLKAARINRRGGVDHPSAIHLFSLDDDKGGMDESQVFEVTGGFYRAFRAMPDAPGPLTWVYPFRELDEMAKTQPERLGEVYFHDAYVRDIVNQGVPLNTVIASEDLLALTEREPEALRDTILLLAAPQAGTALSERVLALLEAGQRAIVYGPLAHADSRLLARLGLTLAAPLAGELALRGAERAHAYEDETPRRIHHRALTSGGGIAEAKLPSSGGTEVLLEASGSDGDSRAYAVVAQAGEGDAFAWIRGSAGLSRNTLDTDFPEAQLFHAVLARLGYKLRVKRALPGGRAIVSFISRRDGAYVVTAHKPDDTTHAVYEFPEGAPLFMNAQALVEDSAATYYLGKTAEYEVRCLVRQRKKSVVSCKEGQRTSYRYARNIEIRGLLDASLYILAPGNTSPIVDRLEIRELGGSRIWNASYDGKGFAVADVSGDVEIRW